MNYKDSGVDIEEGYSLVQKIKESVQSTFKREVIGTFGGFNGMVEVPEGYKNPVLVSGADGVGTKINLAKLNSYGDDASGNRNGSYYYNIGIDLVAMCVNDVITCGADPLYFLDYVSTTKINEHLLVKLISGIAHGCKISDCSLIGGETAVHPHIVGDLYDDDLAGFCTGIIEKDQIIDGALIQSGDQIIGIESSGIHSNGFSLINRLLFNHKLRFEDSDKFLIPTKIYAPLIKNIKEEYPILGMAHITGGGIPENLPRCLPNGLKAEVDYNSWERPEIFNKIQLAAEMKEEDMRSTFNLGIGFCLVVPPDAVTDIEMVINCHDLKSWIIGQVL